MESQPLKKGDRVETTEAKTKAWGRKHYGTVTRVAAGRVYVRWDHTSFEDEMRPSDVRKA